MLLYYTCKPALLSNSKAAVLVFSAAFGELCGLCPSQKSWYQLSFTKSKRAWLAAFKSSCQSASWVGGRGTSKLQIRLVYMVKHVNLHYSATPKQPFWSSQQLLVSCVASAHCRGVGTNLALQNQKELGWQLSKLAVSQLPLTIRGLQHWKA